MTLEIETKDYEIIRAGLMELPSKLSHELINKLDVQVALILKLDQKQKTEGETK